VFRCVLRPRLAMADVYGRNLECATLTESVFTQTSVTLRGHNGYVGRKPETFNDEENAALRAALEEFHGGLETAARSRGERWSQRRTGEILGVGQQSVATWLAGGGFGRPGADALAAQLGYENGANELIRARGAIANPMTVPTGWAMRDLAITIARRLKYEEEVIRRVVVKYQEQQYANRPARWWNDRIVNEAAEYQATQDTAPLEVKPKAKPKPAPAKERRRKAG
jgi:hypothetical protein